MKLIQGDFKRPLLPAAMSEGILRERNQMYCNLAAWGFAYLLFFTGAAFVGFLFYLA